MRLFDCLWVNKLVVIFGQSFDAACAKNFTNFSAILHHSNALKIGQEFTPGCHQRVTAIMTESCGFTTLTALCHLVTSFAL
jgi:hypothetical protein